MISNLGIRRLRRIQEIPDHSLIFARPGRKACLSKTDKWDQ